jgi:hypothetical protein
VCERLIDHAVALGQPEQRRDLLVAGVGVEIEAQADGGKPDRRVLAHGQRPAEVQVAFGVHGSAGDGDLQRGGHGPKRDPRAGDKCLQEHVPGTDQ